MPDPSAPNAPSAPVATRLRAAGDRDAALGIERTVARLLDGMVRREAVLKEVGADLSTRREKAKLAHGRALSAIEETRVRTTDEARSTRRNAIDAAEDRASAKIARLDETRERRLSELRAAHDSELKELTRDRDEALLMAEAVREAGEEAELKRLRELSERVAAAVREADELEKRARDYVRSCRLRMKSITEAPDPVDGKSAEAEIAERLERAQEHLDAILATRAARLLAGPAPFILAPAVVIGAAVIGGAATLFDEERWREIALWSGGGAAVFMVLLLIVLRFVARGAMRRVWQPFQEDLLAIRIAKERAIREGEVEREARVVVLREKEAREERRAHERFDEPILEVPRAWKRRSKRVEEATAAERAAIGAERDEALAAAESACTAALAAAEEAAAAARAAELARAEAERDAFAREEESRVADTRREWLASANECREILAATADADARAHPAWDRFDAARDGIASARAEWFRFGALVLEPTRQPGGLSTDPSFAVEMPERFTVPATLGFPHRGNLLLESPPEGRAEALRAAQSLITRLLVSIPPSKVRFTFVDPVGLGESFAAFMHLGDEFEQLVGERIWTEPRAIEQKLVDLSEHMETVIQKYLRNEFEDIDSYNDAAGEIAEPYRFLVCADFPANFSEQAAGRLLSILRAGQRCGVHVILMRNPKAPLPDGITEDDLKGACQIVRQENGAFRFRDGPFAALPLALDAPLADDRLIPLLSRIGAAAKSGSRVEVPFDVIAPKPDAFWSLSSAKGISVPIGRSGATRLQQFALGEGTSQHALVAGKTGSGKSTLLHAIITGVATWYSPDEVELWLVDFKKGVEFKTYAEHLVPHARAVAIESDREFGLSVLEGLDSELSRRGELFRDAGVQDIASFRRARPDVRMPRVLLVIDEFQEFFLDDDKVAQGASMLLDRLVRQGRAFGMHALLGSQTLGGAYSLARSTMGQMGVRIALQCSEADSQLILSDENLAARLLSRPGEAIYNDAGGRPEGNSPFQVAFLPDAKRDGWLGEVETRTKGRFEHLPRIVFEGDARASMRLHPSNRSALAPDPRGQVRVWLGEAVAIKDPTCAKLARASGANIAVISPRDDQAVSTAAAMLLSVAREAPEATIDVFDGTPADAPEAGVLERVARERGIRATFVGYREVEARLAEIAADVTARGESATAPRRFLLIHQLQRYRMLRRNEDDFSFSASEGPPAADKLLAGILREGPVAGVHVLAVVDTLGSLQRSFDRNAMREFDWKALFQISPADSSSLIDSPAASRLGTNRGLLHSEELGLLEKFRPYAL